MRLLVLVADRSISSKANAVVLLFTSDPLQFVRALQSSYHFPNLDDLGAKKASQ